MNTAMLILSFYLKFHFACNCNIVNKEQLFVRQLTDAIKSIYCNLLEEELLEEFKNKRSDDILVDAIY